MAGITFNTENGVHTMRVMWEDNDADFYRLLRSQPAKLPQLASVGMIFQAVNGRFFQTAEIEIKGRKVGVAWPVSAEEQAQLDLEGRSARDEAYAEDAWLRRAEDNEQYRFEVEQDELRAQYGLPAWGF